MGFEVRVNGEKVAFEDRQVIGVSLMSGRGELYRAGISNEGVLDIVLQVVQDGDPIRLDQLEAFQARQRAEFVKELSTGQTPYSVDASMNQRQEVQDNTLRPGGVNPDLVQLGQTSPPSVDLAQGLDPSDSDALTARINDFNQHGDAQRAINDNGPTDPNAPQTAEQGAVPAPPEETEPGENESAPGVEQQPLGTTTNSEGTVTSPPQAVPGFSLGQNTPPPESQPQGSPQGSPPQNEQQGAPSEQNQSQNTQQGPSGTPTIS